jgi:hypothetical protein
MDGRIPIAILVGALLIAGAVALTSRWGIATSSDNTGRTSFGSIDGRVR